jgi:hypothetical protein
MEIHQRAGKKAKGGCFINTSRLTLRASVDEEMTYLAWLANAVRSGQTHQLYIEEKAKEFGILEGLTEEDLSNAREVYRSICEGRSVNLDVGDIEDLEIVGLVRDVRRLPGRGRYAGRYEFMPTDRLHIVVYALASLGRAIL